MKFTFIKSNDKEEVIVYSKEKTDLINSIENMCNIENKLIGYYREEIKILNINSIECFFIENDKVYALLNKKKYLIKKRLYELNEAFKDSFIFINQGCLANIHMIDHFDVSISSSLIVVFKSNYKEYVSRRRIKEIKKRMGLK